MAEYLTYISHERGDAVGDMEWRQKSTITEPSLPPIFMALDPADPIDQQIRETRELFDHLDDRYMALVASFQSLRHPVFLGIRTDKKADEVVREKATGYASEHHT
jgi:hypothetical protein